jgi:hypothetical protein
LDIYSMDPSKIGVRHQTEGENQNWPKKWGHWSKVGKG